MNQRPHRNSTQPLIPVAAGTLDDLRRAVRLIYAGTLADGRSLDGAQGVYTVKVRPPLEVTDDGIVINLHDSRWAGLMRVRCCDDTPVEVDPLQADGDAGEGVLPARGDHRHTHAPLPDDEEELAFGYPLTLAEGAAWDPDEQKLTVHRSDYELKRDAAGHAKWTPDPPDANNQNVTLTGLVCEVTDGTNTVTPCDKVIFEGGTDVDVTVSDEGNYDAKVTISSAAADNDEKVKVSGNDTTADHLDEKLKSFAGDTDHIPSTIAVQAEGADENLVVKIAKSDLAGAVGGSWTTYVFKYHYQGDNSIPATVLNAGDWRGRNLRYWGRAVGGNAVGDLLTSPDDSNAGSWNEFSSWIVTSLDASKGGNNLSFTVGVETADAGKLKYTVTNAAGSCEAWFYLRIDDFGVIPTTGYAAIGDGD